MFHKLFEEQDEIPDYRMYMADGFRESHGYTENGEIETIRNAEHTGILLLFEFPQSVDLEINEEKNICNSLGISDEITGGSATCIDVLW